MAEYEKEQRSQLNKTVADCRTENRQLKGLINNRSLFLSQFKIIQKIHSSDSMMPVQMYVCRKSFIDKHLLLDWNEDSQKDMHINRNILGHTDYVENCGKRAKSKKQDEIRAGIEELCRKQELPPRKRKKLDRITQKDREYLEYISDPKKIEADAEQERLAKVAEEEPGIGGVEKVSTVINADANTLCEKLDKFDDNTAITTDSFNIAKTQFNGSGSSEIEDREKYDILRKGKEYIQVKCLDSESVYHFEKSQSSPFVKKS